MKTLLSTLLIALLLLGCQKEQNTTTTGTYTGAVNINLEHDGHLQYADTALVSPGYYPDQLYIRMLGLPYPATALVNGQQLQLLRISTGGSGTATTLVIYAGTGHFANDTLSLSGTLEMASNGFVQSGSWSANYVKQR